MIGRRCGRNGAPGVAAEGWEPGYAVRMSTQRSDSTPDPFGPDPFGTAEIRRRVLAGWRASPARFREDANAEEDFALGGYRDRLVVELAQNAADAAVRAGAPGRLRLTLTSDALLAANTGEPLTAAGVQALATLRASHKADPADEPDPADERGPVDEPERPTAGPAGTERGGPGAGEEPDERSGRVPAVVGRFGVGFAAVTTVSDEPEVHSADGGVRFSRRDTAAEVRAIGELADELARRSGQVPALRLPYPAAPAGPGGRTVPDGFDTLVRLPLRDADAYTIARRALLAVDDTLLLALPALEMIELELDDQPPRVLTGVEDRWRVFSRGGYWTENERAELLADRPTEERNRASWSVTWALPRPSGQSLGEPGASEAVGWSGLAELLDVPEPSSTSRSADSADSFGNRPTEGSSQPPVEGGIGVLHAPTPTDETHSLPALLIASFPLDPGRQRVRPGPLTDRLVAEAARGYADLIATLAAEAGGTGNGPVDVLDLVPVGLPVSEFDATLSAAVRELLPGVPMLPTVASDPDGAAAPLPGRDAVTVPGLDQRAAAVLASVVPNLVLPPGANRAVLDVLGVRRVALAEVVEELAGVAESRPPSWWRELYEACVDLVADPLAAEALGALPVPLADGRTVHGPRGVLLPYGADSAGALGVLVGYGMRVAHPDATSGTLERLGARPADPATLLRDPATRAAIQRAARVADEGTAADEPASVPDRAEAPDRPDAPDALDSSENVVWSVVNAVLHLARSAPGALEPGEIPWLGDLPLPATDGEFVPAASLVLPGSVAERLLDPDEFAVVDDELVQRWGSDALRVVGVLATFGVLRLEDVDLASLPDELSDLPDIEDWAEERLPTVEDPIVGEFVAVRDLDLVPDEVWPEALRVLSAEPEPRRALLADSSYTAWWIGGHLGSVGTADPDADADVAGLLLPAPDEVTGLDPAIRAQLGTRRELDDLRTSDLQLLLDALADPEVRLDSGTLVRVWRRLARLVDQVDRVDPAGLPEVPERIRVLSGAETRLVLDAVVVDSPMWLQLESVLGDTGMLAAGAEAARPLAMLFDLPMIDEAVPELLPAAERVHGVVVPDDQGTRLSVPAVVRQVLPAAPEFWFEHDEVRIAGHPVDWWVDDDGMPHAATTEGLARGLAWASGAEQGWPARYAIAAVLADPDNVRTVLPESAFDQA